MQSEKGRLIGEALLRDKKNARPRLVKEYRTEEERVSWEMFLGAIVFLILGVSILVNTITGFGKAAWVWNVLPLLIAIIFIGLGFISAKALKENIEDCARFRNERKKAQECGTLYFGEIKGYKVTIEEMQGKGRSGVTYYVSYILEVHLDTGRTKRVIQTPKMKYHPNSVLKSNRCAVYWYDKKYYFNDFEVRTKRTDETIEIPQKGVEVGGIFR